MAEEKSTTSKSTKKASSGVLMADAVSPGEATSALPPAPNVKGEDLKRASEYGPQNAPQMAQDPDATLDKGGKDAEYFARRADTEWQNVDPNYRAARQLFESGPTPELKNAKLDEATKGLIAGQEERAGADERQIVAERLAGTEYGKEALNRAMEGQQASEMGLGGQNSFLEAIQRRVGKGFDREMNTMKRRAGIGAAEEKFNRLRGVMETKDAQMRVQKKIADAEYIHKRNVQAAKNKMLGSVLGLAGTVAGGMAGGSSGAAAGSQAGGLAGNQTTENV